jgi:hypothetical protein
MGRHRETPVEARTKKQMKADAAADKARAKAERPIWKKKRVIIPVVLLLIIVVAALGSDGGTEPELVTDDPEAAEQAEQAEEAADAAEEAQDEELAEEVAEGFGIGDTVAMGELEHTFHGARFYEGDDFMSPEDGRAWLLVDVEVTNTGDDSTAISSMIMWSVVDSDNRTADQTITADERGSVDGELGAGRSMRGEIAYEVSADETEWELIFSPQVFGFGQAIYEFSANEVE